MREVPRIDDGGGLIEYDKDDPKLYYVLLKLDGVEIARRGPYRDQGDRLMQQHEERIVREEFRRQQTVAQMRRHVA